MGSNQGGRERRKAWRDFGGSEDGFADPLARITPDVLHSEGEERYFLVGYSERRRMITVSYTDRADQVRVISARLAKPSERKSCEDFIR